MAKVLKTVALVAGVVALAATGVGAFAVAGSALAATAASVASIATVVSGVAALGARALTKPPPKRGSVTDAIIQVDPPMAYCMGEGYFAGVKRHHTGYGPTLDDVPNPYLFEVYALSTGGPIEGPITPQFDFAAPQSFYSAFLETDTRLGATPDTALVAGYGSPPGWGTDYKLSGTACIAWNHLFDKKGKRYASGLPQRGVVAKWVKVYDPRLDSTFPGGSGLHRLGDEATYEWSENPALHAGTYAYGRFQNGKRVFGMGLPVEAIGFDNIAAWANDCDANDWRMFGVIFEGSGITPDQRWQNLRDICIAGSGEPLPLHTGVGFHWDRPRVILDTVTEADVAGEVDATGMQSFRDRINTIVPEYLSEASNWERIKAEPIVGSTYLAEDGEPNSTVFPFNFVKDEKQAGELAAYKLANGREFYPITIPLMPRMRAYRPGDCLQLDIAQAGLDTPAVMLTRSVNPATGEINAVFIGETPAKHAYALGETAVPPPTPALGQTPEERDNQAAAANDPAGLATLKLSGSYTRQLAGNITLTLDGDNRTDVGIPNHVRVYADGTEVSVTGDTLNFGPSIDVLIFYDDTTLAGGAVTYDFVQPGVNGGTAGDAYFSADHPYRHFVARVTTLNGDGTGGGTGGSSPPGGGGWDGDGPPPSQP